MYLVSKLGVGVPVSWWVRSTESSSIAEDVGTSSIDWREFILLFKDALMSMSSESVNELRGSVDATLRCCDTVAASAASRRMRSSRLAENAASSVTARKKGSVSFKYLSRLQAWVTQPKQDVNFPSYEDGGFYLTSHVYASAS